MKNWVRGGLPRIFCVGSRGYDAWVAEDILQFIAKDNFQNSAISGGENYISTLITFQLTLIFLISFHVFLSLKWKNICLWHWADPACQYSEMKAFILKENKLFEGPFIISILRRRKKKFRIPNLLHILFGALV